LESAGCLGQGWGSGQGDKKFTRFSFQAKAMDRHYGLDSFRGFNVGVGGCGLEALKKCESGLTAFVKRFESAKVTGSFI
jgi:hypothetical protein